MKYFLALILVLFAATAQAATMESQYLVVVGEDAPTSDVILGANFAASMKGTVAVTFSSAIDTDLYREIADEELASKTIVVIDGTDRQVKILGTSNAAAAADVYFTRQGFATEMIAQPTREDVLVDPQPPQVVRTVQTPAEQIVEATVEDMETPVDPVPILQPQAAVANNVETTVETNAEAPRTESVFARVLTWFRGLF